MARAYQEMPPLLWLQEELVLSDAYASGLAWKGDNAYHKAGDMAGKTRKDGRYYYVSLLDFRYAAHRLVYYLRTGIDPGNADVMHGQDNPEHDNRKELTLYQRKTARSPRWRRRVRDEDGNLVYGGDDGVSIKQLERDHGLKIIS